MAAMQVYVQAASRCLHLTCISSSPLRGAATRTSSSSLPAPCSRSRIIAVKAARRRLASNTASGVAWGYRGSPERGKGDAHIQTVIWKPGAFGPPGGGALSTLTLQEAMPTMWSQLVINSCIGRDAWQATTTLNSSLVCIEGLCRCASSVEQMPGAWNPPCPSSSPWPPPSADLLVFLRADFLGLAPGSGTFLCWGPAAASEVAAGASALGPLSAAMISLMR
jgi:hypothetical protein